MKVVDYTKSHCCPKQIEFEKVYIVFQNVTFCIKAISGSGWFF